jgi:hypothetical protein
MSVFDDVKKWLKGATQEEKSDFMSGLSKEKELYDTLKAMGFSPDITQVSTIGKKGGDLTETEIDVTRQPQAVSLDQPTAAMNKIDLIGVVARVLSIREIKKILEIQLIDLINTIQTIKTIQTVQTIQTINSIDKVRGLNWYDRNPSQMPKSYYTIAIAPHIATERWSYTVPSGRLAFMESLIGQVMRVSAATSMAYAEVDFYLTPSGGSKTWIWGALIYDNTVGKKDSQMMGQSMMLLTGDKITCETYDGSTGGTCMYSGATKITEFDV